MAIGIPYLVELRVNFRQMKNALLSFGLMLIPFLAAAQISSSDSLEVFDYSEPRDFEIGGITTSGAFFSDENACRIVSCVNSCVVVASHPMLRITRWIIV